MEEQGIGLSPPPEVMLNPAAKAFNLFVRHSSIHSIRSPSVASLASTVAGAQHLQTADEDDDENVSIWGISELRVIGLLEVGLNKIVTKFLFIGMN